MLHSACCRLLLAICVLDTVAALAHADMPTLPAEALVLPGGGRGRGVGGPDPVAAAIAAGAWQPPKAGEEVPSPGGAARTWRAAPLKGNVVAQQGIAYSYVPVKSAGNQVVILHAIGHSAVYVNGEPRGGDIYGNGIMRLPIRLRDGNNDLLFLGGRGQIHADFEEARGAAQLDTSDATVPDLLSGTPVQTMAALLVRNNTEQTLAGLKIEVVLSGTNTQTDLPALPPLSVRKVGFKLVGPALEMSDSVPVQIRLVRGKDSTPLDETKLVLRAVLPGTTHRRTFISDIDGSVQYYSLVPATSTEGKPGLVMTLHGASVEASGQAACFTRKPTLHIVAPTNRRPYGFDWEDWGRLDAMEVLNRVSNELKTDPQRTYLTGHSMGGHGTWHLGVTFPSRFAAIGPSAGWVSFVSYTGGRMEASLAPEREPGLRAASPSDTLSLVPNLAQTGVFILHGDVDDNVPVGQARTMRKQLAEFHADFVYHEEAGAGHWWGNGCVDWVPMFEFFGRHQLPARDKIRTVSFRTANPAVSADCHWLTIEAQVKQLKVSRVEITQDVQRRSFTGTTDNVARLSIDVAHLSPEKPVQVKLDGQAFETVPWPTDGSRIWFVRSGEKWTPASRPAASVKGPQRAGPFKDAFRNRMLFVYGTHGTAEENAWALAKARFDAEQFWYRGNGSVDVVPDTAFDPAREPDRGVILYGHAEMNTAWQPLLGAAPMQVRRGNVRLGGREEKGENLGCVFAYPRPGSTRAMVAVVAGSGLHGMRLTDRLAYFMSGVGLADWTVYDPAGIRGSGFFGNDWSLESGEAAWRK